MCAQGKCITPEVCRQERPACSYHVVPCAAAHASFTRLHSLHSYVELPMAMQDFLKIIEQKKLSEARPMALAFFKVGQC